jgi:hypothetical protein
MVIRQSTTACSLALSVHTKTPQLSPFTLPFFSVFHCLRLSHFDYHNKLHQEDAPNRYRVLLQHSCSTIMTNSNRTPPKTSPEGCNGSFVPSLNMNSHSIPSHQQPQGLRQLMMMTGVVSPLPPLPGMMSSSSSSNHRQLSHQERRERLANMIQQALDMVDDTLAQDFQDDL